MAAQKLSDTAIRNAKPTAVARKLADGKGLFLEVTPSGSKLWRYRFRATSGKETTLSLGSYPAITLAAARQRHLELHQQRRDGVDPAEARRADRIAMAALAANTFEAVAVEWHRRFSVDWSESHARKVLGILKRHAFPSIGSTPIHTLTASVILATLRRVEDQGKHETAHNLRVVVGQVCRFAVATSRAQTDPTWPLRDALKSHKNTNLAAFTNPAEVGGLMRVIHGYSGGLIVKTALIASALTFQRPGNVRMMEWAEINFDDAMWSIPSPKMKRIKTDKENGRPHLVPLSTQAIAQLRTLQPFTGHGKYVFQGQREHDRPISDNTVSAALRTLGYSRDQMTAHGFRAMARTLLEEQLDVPSNIIEAQLAHRVRDALGTAYNRTTHITKRREMMQQWADYLDALASSGKVIRITGRTNMKTAA